MKKAILVSLSFVAPIIASAQALTNIIALVNQFGVIVRTLGPIIFGLAIVFFFWGVAKYILAAGDAKGAAEGRSIMIYGVIAIAVMASVYGLVFFLQTTFGISSTSTIAVPSIPIP